MPHNPTLSDWDNEQTTLDQSDDGDEEQDDNHAGDDQEAADV